MNLARDDLTGRILHAFYAVYNELGYGFLKSVYEASMAVALHADGVAVERQAPAAVYFVGLLLNFGPRPSFRRLVYSDARQARGRSAVQ